MSETAATAIALNADPRPRQPLGLLVAYALAWAGGCIAYTPFLTVLLPQRLTVLAGTGDVRWLGLIATVGAVAASLGNIFWGWLSAGSATACACLRSASSPSPRLAGWW